MKIQVSLSRWMTKSMHSTCAGRCGRRAGKALRRREKRERKRKGQKRSHARRKKERFMIWQAAKAHEHSTPRWRRACGEVRRGAIENAGRHYGMTTYRSGQVCSNWSKRKEKSRRTREGPLYRIRSLGLWSLGNETTC